jgi:hypothetical protein
VDYGPPQNHLHPLRNFKPLLFEHFQAAANTMVAGPIEAACCIMRIPTKSPGHFEMMSPVVPR